MNPKNKRNKEKALNFAYSDLLETGRKEFFAFVPKKKGLILTEIIVSNLCFQYGGSAGICLTAIVTVGQSRAAEGVHVAEQRHDEIVQSPHDRHKKTRYIFSN